ncbi:iron-sulfur cluster biosynthesis chaperone HscA [Alphaproteobacteria bacterium]
MRIYQLEEPEAIQRDEEGCTVGIDLGTTNSLIAYVPDKNPIIIPCNKSTKLTSLVPSVVYYDKNNRIYVGNDALDRKDNISSMKRLMGKGIAEINIEELPLQIDIENSLHNMIRIRTGNGLSLSPAEISAEILAFLKKNAEAFLGKLVNKAVITVPAHFDEAARTATRDAAGIAGLEVLRLLNEPTAAAIAYGLDVQPAGNFLVYDLGGGTFDVSILKMYKGILRVIATGGNVNLGGNDFDLALLKLLLHKAGSNYDDISVKTQGDLMHFLKQACYIKECLSTAYVWEGKFCGKHINIAREEAEICFYPLIEKTLQILTCTLNDAHLSKSNVEEVILVGGVTKIPSVRKHVENFFGIRVKDYINPEEIVAMGAAIQAHALTRQSDHLILDVTPFSLGIELLGNMVEIIIPRNTPIPTLVTQVFTTSHDNQTAFKIHILQGESEKIEECRSLAQFELKNISPLPAGQVHLEVKFCIDADGLLTVTASESSSGRKQEIEAHLFYEL